MDMQRFIELDEMLDEVIALRGQRLAEEIHFAHTSESSRSIGRDMGLVGGGAAVATAGTLGLVNAGKKTVKGEVAQTARQAKSAANKAEHKRNTANNARRKKGKGVMDAVTKRLMSRGKRG
jgi:hypothetical protein